MEYRINMQSPNYPAYRVLLKEPLMRRSTEEYINTDMKTDSYAQQHGGRYVSEKGMEDKARNAKIFVWLHRNELVIERSCEYFPSY